MEAEESENNGQGISGGVIGPKAPMGLSNRCSGVMGLRES